MSLNGSLNALITKIQDISVDLEDFQTYLPEAAPDIIALVSEIYAVSAGLKKLLTVSTDPRNVYDNRYFSEYSTAVVEAIRRTFEDIDRFIQKLPQTPSRSTRESYRIIWQRLTKFFYEQSGYSLFDRINDFRLFLRELSPVLDGQNETHQFHTYYQRIDTLLSDQDAYLRNQFERFDVNQAHPRQKPKSWERKRPVPATGLGRPPPIVPNPPPAAGAYRPFHTSPISPQHEGDFWDQYPGFEAPLSPPASSTVGPGSSAGTPPSSAGSEMARHWLLMVFTQDRPNTIFRITGPESAMFGDHTKGALQQLRQKSYKELLIVPFDNGVEARIFVREDDNKARIYCKYERKGQKLAACRPVGALHVFRKNSNLQLCSLDRKRRNIQWLNLRFASYERLVLFFCAFLALKSLDNSFSHHKLDDHVLKGEIHVFSCTIIDDHYRHALQIYKDECSDGIRLQASVLTGEMKRAPVWTAFINYKIPAREWIKRPESLKIHLGDLTRYVFLPDYTPHMGPQGEHELHFENERDADRFEEIIEDLAEKRI